MVLYVIFVVGCCIFLLSCFWQAHFSEQLQLAMVIFGYVQFFACGSRVVIMADGNVYVTGSRFANVWESNWELRTENRESNRGTAAVLAEAEAVAAPLAILVFTSSLASHNKSHKPNNYNSGSRRVAVAVAATEKLQRQKCTHTIAKGEPTERHSHTDTFVSQAGKKFRNKKKKGTQPRERKRERRRPNEMRERGREREISSASRICTTKRMAKKHALS